MSRMKKVKLTDVSEAAPAVQLPNPTIPEQPAKFEPVDLPLGDRIFTIAPMASRGGEQSYDDSADFTVAAIPLVTRMFNMAVAQSYSAGESTSTDSNMILADFINSIGD